MIGAADMSAQAPTGVVPFQSWHELLTGDERATWTRRFAIAYGAGFLVGLGWGGWRGALAGLLAVSAGANGVATSVYARQSADPYPKVTVLAAGLGLLEALAAMWLAGRVADDKDDEGRSAWSLAH
jgi:hypothetical protein